MAHQLIEMFEDSLQDDTQYLFEFKYDNNEMKEEIRQALLFWLDLRNFRHSNDLSVDEVQDLLTWSQDYGNKLISTIIMIDVLPTSVWRKLLWEENIDFVSFESFLRRIRPEQMQAIADNFYDFQDQKIPRVMKKGMRSKLQVKLGKINYQALQAEDYDYERRYTNKAAWAYNLLGLDFGFCLYELGEANDTMNDNTSPTRFLSIKNHANDFVVQEECGGKYAWMYKKARSNYAFWPKKEVKLNTHICPGFWATLMIHTIFWIVSPLALISTIGAIAAFGFKATSFIPTILALPFIVWIFFACLRAIKDLYLYLKAKEEDSLIKKVGKIIGKVLLIGFYAGGITLSIYYILFDLLFQITGPLLSILLLLSALYISVLAMLTMIKDDSRLLPRVWKKTPKFLRFLMNSSYMATAIIFLDKFVSQHILNFFVNLASEFWIWLTSDLFINSFVLITIAFIASLFITLIKYPKSEEAFVKQENLMMLIIKAYLVILAGYIAYFLLISASFELNYDVLIFLSLALIILGIYLSLNAKVNKTNIGLRTEILDFITDYLSEEEASKELVSRLEDKEIYLHDMSFFLHDLKIGCVARKQIFLFLSKMPPKVWEFILKQQEELAEVMEKAPDSYRVGNKHRDSEDYIFEVIEIMSKDLCKASVAKKAVDKKHKALNEKREKDEKDFQAILRFFSTIFHPLTWVFKKIGSFLSQLNYLWTELNKRCPYIFEKRVLR